MRAKRNTRARFGAGLFDELVIDSFAGGGGASLGIEKAIGRAVDAAVNHDPEAVALHTANHPHTRHYCEDVWTVDPLEVTGGRPVGLAWFSPDCKHFSRAKGAKPVSKKIRGLAWVVVKWAKLVRPRVIMLENVREFATWGPLVPLWKCKGFTPAEMGPILVPCRWKGSPENLITSCSGEKLCPSCGGSEVVSAGMVPCPIRKGQTFKRWIGQIRRLGYKVEYRNLDAADYGAPTHRRRLFLIARNDGAPIVWPEPTHGPGRSKPYRTAAECIDWSLPPCPSIYLTPAEGKLIGVKRPLAEKTLKRIAKGLERYVFGTRKPFIVEVNHGGDEFRGQSIDKPLSTVTQKHGKGLVAPFLTAQYGERLGQAPRTHAVTSPIPTITPREGGGLPLVFAELLPTDARVVTLEKPLGTVTSVARPGLVAPYVVRQFHGDKPADAVDEPLRTVTSQGNKFSLIAPTLIQYNQEKGNEVRGLPLDVPINTVTSENRYGLTAPLLTRLSQTGGNGSYVNDVTDPLTTITSKAEHLLVSPHLSKFFGGVVGQTVDQPAPTITSVDHTGLVAAHLTKLYGTSTGSDAFDPMPTVTGGGLHIGEVRAFLTKYFGTGGAASVADPLPTVTAHDRFGIVMVAGQPYQLVDVGLRMLTPRELYRAQSFPDSYRIEITYKGRRLPKSAQVRMCGNSVPPVMSEMLVRANIVDCQVLAEATA